MSEVLVRPAREHELDAVGEITLEAYRADGYFEEQSVGDGYADELADAGERARAAELLVAVDAEDRLLGTVTVVRAGSPFAEVSREGELEFRMLAVAVSARRRGVGEALIRAVADRARTLRLRRVVMCSWDRMTSVHRLYDRLGFRRLPERDWQPSPGVQLIAFELDLDAKT
jgi:GNAT superfamily N-acetyltransferase